MRTKGQVNGQVRRRNRALATQFLNRLGNKAAVQVKPDRVHEPALLRSEQVPGATDLQVLHRNPEPRTEVRRLEDRPETLLGRLGQAPCRVVEEVGICLLSGPPHTSPQLV